MSATALGLATAASAQTRRLYWSESRGAGVIDSVDTDGSNRRTVLNLQAGDHPWGIAVEPTRGELYWGLQYSMGPDASYSIYRSDSGVCNRLRSTPHRVLAIALDAPRGKMYWIDNPCASGEGKVYWSGFGDPAPSYIRRANLDGTFLTERRRTTAIGQS